VLENGPENGPELELGSEYLFAPVEADLLDRHCFNFEATS